MQIVIAWAEQTKLVPDTGYAVRDRNLFPKMRLDWDAKAAMWLRSGSEADRERAEAFARTEGASVFTFPTTERDPLGKARNLAVENARRET